MLVLPYFGNFYPISQCLKTLLTTAPSLERLNKTTESSKKLIHGLYIHWQFKH